ncbi:MFS transporter [Leifsonia sp. fls2-241-R2A-40a]|uniref:MFS transporter n=1 Tax=Leifsonia sp. fls2-241-R2A-40a TaxID=3040290 RepID=UPI00254C355F|nr:MFS transporter [Leifsonia sp. fls2-241-R2A-40a]
MSDTPEQPRPSDETPDARPEDAVQPEETVTPAEVSVRRSPRYFRFMITGAVLFGIIALILTFSFPENPTYDRGSVFGFLLAVCATIGVAVGAVVALLLDRATARRARSVQADRIDVRIPESGSSPARRDGSQPEPGTQNDSTSDTQS